MGQLLHATCKDCGFSFKIKDGGGLQFCLARCDRCGRSKTVGYNGSPGNAEIKAGRSAGECRCGGTFKCNAPPRCPK